MLASFSTEILLSVSIKTQRRHWALTWCWLRSWFYIFLFCHFYFFMLTFYPDIVIVHAMKKRSSNILLTSSSLSRNSFSAISNLESEACSFSMISSKLHSYFCTWDWICATLLYKQGSRPSLKGLGSRHLSYFVPHNFQSQPGSTNLLWKISYLSIHPVARGVRLFCHVVEVCTPLVQVVRFGLQWYLYSI